MSTAAVGFAVSPGLQVLGSASTHDATASTEVSRLMQKNRDDHHVFFNDFGFHDHIAHHMLSLWALGASPKQMQYHYDRNSTYQRSPELGTNKTSDEVATVDGFMKSLGKHGQYSKFLAFFGSEIASKGVESVVDEYLFGDNERAKALFSRLFAGVIHPAIHFGFAIEYNLPGMVAEALSWAAMHPDELQSFYAACDAKTVGSDPKLELFSIYKELQPYASAAQEALPLNAGFPPTRYQKFLAVDDGVFASIIAKYRVTEENVEQRVHEAINVSAYVALASQRRPYLPKVDFFTVHANNASVYLPALLKSLGPKRAARFVERQIRANLIDFVSVGAPAFDLEYTLSFVNDPAKQKGSSYPSWEAIFAKANELNDDGHVVKAMRAFKGAEETAGKQTAFAQPLKADEILGLAGVVMRSLENEPDFVEAHGPTNQWVRRAGFGAAWEPISKSE